MTVKPRRPNPGKKRAPKKLIPDRLAGASPVRPDHSRMECVYITPAIAQEWMKRNKMNRPAAKQKLNELKRLLEIGKWQINGETIKFDVKAILRDGQTRLQAIIETGISAWCWVCYDIDSGCFDTIDQGRSRTLGHVLATKEKRLYNDLAHAAKVVYMLDDDTPEEVGGFVTDVGLTILNKRPDIEKSLAFVVSIGVRDIYSIGTAAAMHYLMAQIDVDLANKFWESIGSGVIANKRSPLKAVRDALLSNKKASTDKRLRPRTIMAIIIKAWCLMREGRTCRYIRWNGTGSFPRIK